MYRLLPILCSIILSCPLLSQQSDQSEYLYYIPDEYSNIHHKGEQALLRMKYAEALRYFKKVLKKFPDFPPALRSAGACMELSGELTKAKEYYASALAANPFFSRAMYYEVANLHYKSGEYHKALEYFIQFDSLLKEDPKLFTYNGFEESKIEELYAGKLESSIKACHIALDSIKFLNIESVENLGDGVNSNEDEYFPFLTNDGSTLYYTSRKDEFHDEDLMIAKIKGKEWGSGRKVNGFNTAENEGMTTFVRDGKTVYFTACQRETVLGTCDLWQGTLDDESIVAVRSIDGKANSISWESQASISCDGSVLYFASNREGGSGGTDIWVSKRLPNGSWGEATNLGSLINTPGDEEAPYITNDGQVLYFSSTGHIGLGEQDIFMTRLLGDGSWSAPINLGMPVNSAFRELGFFLSADGSTGYFASDRLEGFGGMDIYSFQLPEALVTQPITYVEGLVIDSITHLPVQANVEILNKQVYQTDEKGRIFLCVDAGDTLKMKVNHKSYHPFSTTKVIPEWSNETFYSLELRLDPLFKLPVYEETVNENATLVSFSPEKGKTISHNVLFDFDKAQLQVESIKQLERFVSEISEKMEIKDVEIIGFADAVGSDKYNYELSEKRAKEVGIFLKERGFSVSKVYIEGKGESANDLPDWQNRRVEVVVHLAQ